MYNETWVALIARVAGGCESLQSFLGTSAAPFARQTAAALTLAELPCRVDLSCAFSGVLFLISVTQRPDLPLTWDNLEFDLYWLTER